MNQIHRHTPSWNGLRTASVGNGAFSDVQTGADFLRDACATLRAEGFQAVVGPMDGNTWGRYRLPQWSDGSPGFSVEPVAGPHDLDAYRLAGFEVVEEHVSATARPGAYGVWKPRSSLDLVVRSWDGEAPERLLRRAHGVTMQAFAHAPFFTEIPPDVFVAAYMPFLERVPPRFVLEAVNGDGGVAGFALTFPDPVRKDALIFKTYAGVVPGAGRAMAEHIHVLAEREGLEEVVWALMRCGIASQAQSLKFEARVFRRYQLMGVRL